MSRRASPQGIWALNINQPKVSALANYRLEGFSVEACCIF
jgi:predicted XRE-type DNA-binding protein